VRFPSNWWKLFRALTLKRAAAVASLESLWSVPPPTYVGQFRSEASAHTTRNFPICVAVIGSFLRVQSIRGFEGTARRPSAAFCRGARKLFLGYFLRGGTNPEGVHQLKAENGTPPSRAKWALPVSPYPRKQGEDRKGEWPGELVRQNQAEPVYEASQ